MNGEQNPSLIQHSAFSIQHSRYAGSWLLAADYSSRGFTLLEVLVATSILSIVLAILYGVFSQTLTSKRIAEDHAALSRTARVVLLRMGEDIQASFPLTPENARFVSKTYRTSAFPQASLSFMSFANAQLTNVGREGDWSEIAYELRPDPLAPTLWQLVRRVRLTFEAARSSGWEEQEAEVLPLLSRVQGLRFRFFDGRTWFEEWGEDQTQARIPQAVEVDLMLALASRPGVKSNEQLEGMTFSTLIDLPLARPVGTVGRVGGGS